MTNAKFKMDPSEIVNALQSALNATNTKIDQLTTVFDIVQKVLEKDKFKQAALTLVSEIADRHKAERASIGWLKHDYIVLKAISHTDHFEKKMQIVRDLEGAMEEAYEQDASILFPPPENIALATRIHEKYCQTYNMGCMLSVPIRHGDEIIGVISCERKSRPFNDQDATQIHLASSLCSARLLELYSKSSWFGARMVRSIRKGLGKILGYEHTWAKFFSIIGIAFVLFATLYPLEYKVSSPAILKTDKIIYLTAPFDGYIDSVYVKPGDVVYKDQEILRLDQEALKLEEADLLAQEQDNRREIQKAQASRELAEMRIHQAKLAQTLAKLKTVRYKLSKAIVRATVDSAIIVEGDLQKKIGAPVNQGAELFQLASIENIYVESDVSELEIGNIPSDGEGLLAIKSRPDYVYRFKTERISPTATVKDQENTFPVRGEFVNKVPNWFRPGMTGISKIYAGKKTLWWILSHQAIDYLRLKLWW